MIEALWKVFVAAMWFAAFTIGFAVGLVFTLGFLVCLGAVKVYEWVLRQGWQKNK